MNKKALIIVVVVVVVGALWFMMGNKGSAPAPGNESIDATTNSDSGVFKGSMLDLMKRGGSYRCTYAVTSEQGKFEGTAYVSGKKVRVDSSNEIAGPQVQKMESHMINDGEFIYTWSPAMPQGVKMAAPKDETVPQPGAEVQGQYDYNQKVDYKCFAWTDDNTMLTPPTNIQFMTLPTR
ncbi:MAG: hypothetical protein WCO03_01925 [bacterium]